MSIPSDSQKTLIENEKWLKENQEHTFHRGDLPVSDDHKVAPLLQPGEQQ